MRYVYQLAQRLTSLLRPWMSTVSPAAARAHSRREVHVPAPAEFCVAPAATRACNVQSWRTSHQKRESPRVSQRTLLRLVVTLVSLDAGVLVNTHSFHDTFADLVACSGSAGNSDKKRTPPQMYSEVTLSSAGPQPPASTAAGDTCGWCGSLLMDTSPTFLCAPRQVVLGCVSPLTLTSFVAGTS